jgi:hypothetical protein
LTGPEAAELARRLLLGIQRPGDDHVIAAMVERSGSIPFLVHALAHRLHDADDGPVSTDDVATAFVAFMDDRDDSRAVTHLVTRLDPLYGDRAPAAEQLLDRVAIANTIDISDVAAPDALVDDLIDDHYLIERDGAIRWRHDVLRRIWIHRRRLA